MEPEKLKLLKKSETLLNKIFKEFIKTFYSKKKGKSLFVEQKIFSSIDTDYYFRNKQNVFKGLNVYEASLKNNDKIVEIHSYDFLFTDIFMQKKNKNNMDLFFKKWKKLYSNAAQYHFFLVEDFKYLFKSKNFNLETLFATNYFKIDSVIRLPENFTLIYPKDEMNIRTSREFYLLLVSSANGSDNNFIASLDDKLVKEHDQISVVFKNLKNFINLESSVQDYIKDKLDHGTKVEDIDLGKVYDKYNYNISQNINLKHNKDTSSGKYLENANYNSLIDGFSEPILFLRSFDYWILENELSRIKSDFTKYETLFLEHLVKQIKVGKYNTIFKPIPNSIFLPLIGSTDCEDNFDKLILKPHNYAQIVVNNKKITASYLKSYLNSILGKKVIKLAHAEGVGPRLRLSNINNMMIALPTIEIQHQISDNIAKINDIQQKISEIKNSIALNPVSSKEEISSINYIQEIVSNKSKENELLNIIRKGESTHLEFKESLSNNKHTIKRDNNLETAALKTIVGFLNINDGGRLIIGVHDDGHIIGLNEELKKFYAKYSNQVDRICLHLKEIIKKRIGVSSFSYIEYECIKIQEKYIIVVECKKSDKEVFLDKRDFYVRRGPTTEKLEGIDLTEHVRKNFK